MSAIYVRDKNGNFVPVKALIGPPGHSPEVSIEDIDGGHRVIITDASGEKSFDVMDGKSGSDGGASGADGKDGGYYTPYVSDGVLSWTGSQSDMPAVESVVIKGEDGEPGNDGVSPVVDVNKTDGVAIITVTDVNGIKTAEIFDGVPGKNGSDGYTPVKGVDYFDGTNGSPGEDGFSPTVEVVELDGGHRVTITDINGSKSFDVLNGKNVTGDGTGGFDGEDGGYYIPAVSDGVLSWSASKAGMPAVESADISGPAGNPGVHVGGDDPEDPDVRLWIDPEGEDYPAVSYQPQTLTEEQQMQARDNIGAASAETVSQLYEEIDILQSHSTSISGNYFDPTTMLLENKQLDFATGELSDTQWHNVLIMPIVAGVRCAAYRWDATNEKNVNISGAWAIFDNDGVYHEGTNNKASYVTSYDGYMYIQISKGNYGDGKIMFLRGFDENYIPADYAPYELGFAMEKVENLPKLAARVDKLERVCVPGISAIKEIYLTDVDLSRELVVKQFRKAYFDGTKYVYSLRIAYADDSVVVSQFMLSLPEVSNDFTGQCVVKLNPSYSTVEGYAYIDYDAVADGTSVFVAQPINKAYVTHLADTPNIHAYLISQGKLDGIVALNKDKEALVINTSKSRSDRFGDTITPLEFVHFSDVHAQKTEWQRIVDYINEYEKYMSFAIHTGDFVGTSMESYVDLYSIAKPKNKPILNSCGNHDTYQNDTSPMGEATQGETFNALFGDTDGWDVTFGNEANAMYYYKDFEDSRVRLIVLDEWHWTEAQAVWFDDALDGAKTAGYHVITAAHTVTARITEDIECGFVPVDNIEQFNNYETRAYESQIVAFKAAGGVHVCHLSGHYHYDNIGYSAAGILNVIIECATHYNAHTESVRVTGTKSFDCFNVVGVDVNTSRLKIVRIGCNTNAALLGKNVLCYDYANKQVIAAY